MNTRQIFEVVPPAVRRELEVAATAAGLSRDRSPVRFDVMIKPIDTRATAINFSHAATCRALADSTDGAVARHIDQLIGADRNAVTESYARYVAADRLLQAVGIHPEK